MTVTEEELARAVALLRAGDLVAFPTETVYGLGADAASPAALAHLYAVKGRPADHPVIVHVASIDALDGWAQDVPPAAVALAAACWPGPLTLVLRRAAGVLDAVTGRQDTVGLRVPDQPVALALLRAFGGGLAAPSANRFGRVSPTSASDVLADLGDDVAMVLDGGPCRVGVESTIVDCTRDVLHILRRGGVEPEAVAEITGLPVRIDDGETDVRAPGMLESHYAPRARVRVVEAAEVAAAVEDELGRGAQVGVILVDGDAGGGARVLGRVDGATAYAHELYRMLRAADEQGLDVVVATAPADDGGLGAAVADRLRRAGAPRGTT